MATITCSGNCLTCEHRLNGETDPRECASIFGFMAVQNLQKTVESLKAEIDKLKVSEKRVSNYSEPKKEQSES